MNSKFIALTPEIYNYVLTNRSDAGDDILAELRAETAALGGISEMQVAPEQGLFLQILAGLCRSRRALEIGTFTGLSALCIARGLAADGTLMCLDQSGEWTQIAQRFWERAGVAGRIELRLGDARETLQNLVAEKGEPFDFVFIDADKSSYDGYFETVLPHCAPGACILFDNTLRGGRLATKPLSSLDDIALDALNRKLAADSRIDVVLLPFADGLTLCRVK